MEFDSSLQRQQCWGCSQLCAEFDLGIGLRVAVQQNTEAGHRLLRARGKGPTNCHAPEQNNELPPPHSITSLAPSSAMHPNYPAQDIGFMPRAKLISLREGLHGKPKDREFRDGLLDAEGELCPILSDSLDCCLGSNPRIGYFSPAASRWRPPSQRWS
jgi:hypothetical protein